MTKLQRIIASAVASGSLLASAALPLMAQTTIVISGNGAGSDNYATVGQTSVTTINQSNEANVTNNVEAEAETGENDANFNTGGDVTISTGAATATAVVTNELNSNAAEVECCPTGPVDVEISGNGAFSDNQVQLVLTNVTTLNQGNKANVYNDVEVEAETGENDANLNTGGDVTIMTGKAKASAVVSTHANENWASIAPALGSGGSSSVSLKILDNGAGSSNWIQAALSKVTTLNQTNYAYVKNEVEAEAESGENEANFNTGGDVLIDTGDAEVGVVVDNDVNFNWAALDCGCAWGLFAKIEGNGADPEHQENGPDNGILASLTSVQTAGQGNQAKLYNELDDEELEADTGDNEAKLNTGEGEGDPSILTGDATVTVGVSNSGNVNQIGGALPLPWPLPPVEFNFNWAGFWAFFGLLLG